MDSLPLRALLVLTFLMGLAPFVPMPHLAEKTLMLVRGELTTLVDILDLLLHGIPPLLLVAKLVRLRVLDAES